MADSIPGNMVLRTLYLPVELDRRLKVLAFTRGVSKGELTRELIERGLAKIASSGERSSSEPPLRKSASSPKASLGGRRSPSQQRRTR